MLATNSRPAPRSQNRLLGRTDSPLTLLIRGGEHNGRTLRIAQAKCTIGSAAGCTLRLRTVGVRPLHCWILRGARATLLRTQTADVQLNGAAVRDAYLKAGDRLRIGTVELEVVTGTPEATSLSVPAAAFEPSLEVKLTAECRTLAERLQTSSETLRQREADIDELRSSAQAQIDQHREAFHLLRNERDQMHAQLALEQSQWQAERSTFAKQLSEAVSKWTQSNEEATFLRAEHQRQREDFQNLRIALERDLAAAQAIAQERRDTLEQLRGESAEQNAQRANLVAQLRQEIADLQANRSQDRDELQAASTRLAADNSALVQQLNQQRAQLEQQAEAGLAAQEQAVRERDAAQAEAQQLTLRLQQSDEELAHLHNQLQAALTQRDEQQQNVATLDERLRQCLAELAEAQSAARQPALPAPGAMTMPFDRLSEELAAPAISLPTGTDEHAIAENALAEARATWLAERGRLEAQIAELWEELATQQAAVEKLQQQRNQLESEAAAHADRVTELAAQIEQLNDQLTAVRGEAGELREQIAQPTGNADEQSSLLELRQQLEAEQDQLAAAQQQWNRQRVATERQLEEQQTQLQAWTEELARESQALADRLAQLNEQEAAWNGRHAAAAAPSIESQQSDVEPAGEQVFDTPVDSEQVSDLPDQPAALPEIEAADEFFSSAHCRREVSQNAVSAEAFASAEEANVDSVLARLAQQGLLRNEQAPADAVEEAELPSHTVVLSSTSRFEEQLDEQPEQRQEIAPALEASVAITPAPVRQGSNSHEEESIESYMSRLLSRVRGEGETGYSTNVPAARPAAAVVAAEAARPDAAQERIVAMIEPVKESEYIPRTQAPEQNVDLAAMRELANSAARSAITTHTNKRLGKRAAGKVLGSVLSLITSATLGYWSYQSRSLTAGVAAVFGLLIAVYWAFQVREKILGLLVLQRPAAPNVDRNEK